MNIKLVKSAESALNYFSLFVLRLLVLVPLFFLYFSFKAESVKKVSIIEYNVWNGFESEAKRTSTFVEWARKQNVDVIAFEELNNFTQESFSKLAKSWGHPYAVIAKENGYPVGITSRYPIRNVYRLMDGMHHGCLYAEINGISFFVVHFSPFSSTKRVQETKSVIEVLQQRGKLNDKTIILGDFNSFSPQDSLFYSKSGIRDSMYLAQQKNKVLQNLNNVNELDYQIIRAFEQMGFYDGFSLFHKKFEESYPSKVYPSVPMSEKIRIDYMMISQQLKTSCKSVEIIKDKVTDTLSDHYPLRAEFEFKK